MAIRLYTGADTPMKEVKHLQEALHRIDGKGYKAYEDIRGDYHYGPFLLFIDHVQGDPFAPPSRLRVRMEQSIAGFPSHLWRSPVRRVALADAITRAFAAAIRSHSRGRRGTGGSGIVSVDEGGQEILPRTSCVVNSHYAEVRFCVGLPAAGRTCLGREAWAILGEEIPRIVSDSLPYSAHDPNALDRFVAVAEDQEALREELAPHKLVAFAANGSILPRESGISDRPLRGEEAIKFTSPKELEIELTAPNQGKVLGMGVPEGITIIVGGSYHGKSTLLSALSRGVYNHVPGDGREYVVTRGDAVKIRAEDGRRIERVDISPFISNLPFVLPRKDQGKPFGQDTRAFCTDNASGSTSQAANIVEALECGTSLLLMDEDTCATNFMIRDSRMQRLIPKEKEPIIPFIDHVGNLYEEHGISTILVMGGSSDYFEVADTIIAMDHYLPRVVTKEAKRLAQETPNPRKNEARGPFGPLRSRIPLVGAYGYTPLPNAPLPHRQGRVKVGAKELEKLRFGDETIELDSCEQLVDLSQTRAIGEMLAYALRQGYMDGRATFREALARLFSEIDEKGLDVISPFSGQHPGDYARPRPQEVAAALNRLRSLKVR